MKPVFRKIRDPGVMFLDSGAYGLYAKHSKGKTRNKYEWFESPAFKKYVDNYAKFILKFKDGMDYYANVDILYNPKLSWKVLKYLENKYELNPVPVVHSLTPIKWLKRHIDAGYEFIGLGGRGTGRGRGEYQQWADEVFEYICPPSNDYKPIVRIHGFALTSYDLLLRYPWWSVDSTSWVQGPSWGSIDVPHKRGGKFVFTEQPYSIMVSLNAPSLKEKNGIHFFSCSRSEQRLVLDWLEEVNVPLGSKTEWGVCSEHNARKVANLRFYERLAQSLPEWPWSFYPKGIRRKTLL